MFAQFDIDHDKVTIDGVVIYDKWKHDDWRKRWIEARDILEGASTDDLIADAVAQEAKGYEDRIENLEVELEEAERQINALEREVEGLEREVQR